MISAALRSQTFSVIGFQAIHEKYEKEYMDAVSKLRDSTKTLDLLAKMTAHLTIALQKTGQDVLGPLFMEGFASAGLGQFFTPNSLSKTIAESILPENESSITEDYITILEPSCGVGGMVIAADTCMRERGISTEKKTVWTCVDIDRLAINCAYIQLSLLNIPAKVFWGNTLSGEMWEMCPTLSLVINNPKVIIELDKKKETDANSE